jgi:hypothetical protein
MSLRMPIQQFLKDVEEFLKIAEPAAPQLQQGS